MCGSILSETRKGSEHNGSQLMALPRRRLLHTVATLFETTCEDVDATKATEVVLLVPTVADVCIVWMVEVVATTELTRLVADEAVDCATEDADAVATDVDEVACAVTVETTAVVVPLAMDPLASTTISYPHNGLVIPCRLPS